MKIGIILATFSCIGTYPLTIERLNTWESGTRIFERIFFKRSVEMPFRSSDFLPFKSITTFEISSAVMGILAQLNKGIIGRGAGSGGLTLGCT